MPAHSTSASAPLIGAIDGGSEEAIVSSLVQRRGEGYREFKGKIGVRAMADELRHTAAVQAALHPGEWLRLDGNQALDLASAQRLAAVCDPGRVRCVEQPLPSECWVETRELVRTSPVPIALDEAIATPADVERAAHESHVQFIKLKWMKQGSRAGLVAAVETARTCGLRVILGNGVATACNNRLETIFWDHHLRGEGLAGEMNGFLRTARRCQSLLLENGCAVAAPISAGTVPFDEADCIARESFE